jgi:hypothetical protein
VGLLYAIINILAGTGYLNLDIYLLWDFVFIAVLILIGPIGLYKYLELKRKTEMQQRLPDFLTEVGDSLATGMNIFDAIKKAEKGNYGKLSPEIKQMKTKLFLLLILVALVSCTTKTNESLTNQEQSALRQAIKTDTVFASWVEDTLNAIKLYKQYKVNLIRSDSAWERDQKRLKKIEDFGYTNRFELIPLVERLHGNAEFRKGEGVSYLIRTDNSTILFDTGVDDDSIMCAFRYNLAYWVLTFRKLTQS